MLFFQKTNFITLFLKVSCINYSRKSYKTKYQILIKSAFNFSAFLNYYYFISSLPLKYLTFLSIKIVQPTTKIVAIVQGVPSLTIHICKRKEKIPYMLHYLRPVLQENLFSKIWGITVMTSPIKFSLETFLNFYIVNYSFFWVNYVNNINSNEMVFSL